MAFSETERCNAALTAIGARRITSRTEDSKEGRVCNARFDAVRDGVLRAHPWNFAMARASLPALSAAPAWGYARQFQLPVDCLRMWAAQDLKDEEWEVEGRVVLSDAGAPLNIRYIRRADNPADWDAGFAEAFSARLAAEISTDIVDETTTTERMWALYRDKLAEARRSDAQEGSAEEHPESEWLTARV